MTKPSAAMIAKFAALTRVDLKAETEANAVKRIRARIFGMGVRQTCGRCGGCGNYSFNLVDGTRCYGCNGAGEITPALNKATLARVEAAVASGALDAYMALRKAQADARAAIKPLVAEVKALSDRVYAAANGRAGFTRDETGACVRSYSFRITTLSGKVYRRACDVENLVSHGARDLDPEQGVLFAVEILRECVAELRQILTLAESTSVEDLRAAVHAPFSCRGCGAEMRPFADLSSGQKVACQGGYTVANGSGCFTMNIIP